MSLLADLRERFTKAQERRQELEQTLEERREAQAKAKALELQIEAEEWAGRAPALLMELKEILGDLPGLYFTFEMTARSNLNQRLFQAPAAAYLTQSQALSTLYHKHGAGDFSIHTGERLASRGGRVGFEGVDTRYSGSYDPAAQAAELRKKGPDYRHQAYALEQMAEEQARKARLAGMKAPEWLPRLAASGHHGVANATVLKRAWEANTNE